jgi:glycosyltransferase involved in cell wall biosynthesis
LKAFTETVQAIKNPGNTSNKLTNEANPKKKVALLVNMISPARIPLYSRLAEAFDLLILHGGMERNRDSWRGFEHTLLEAKVIRAWGWQIPLARRRDGQAFDERYLHFNPGYLWHLLRFAPDVIVSNEMGVRTLIALLYGSISRKPVWVWWGGTLHTEAKKSGRIRRLLRFIFARWAKNWISYGRSSTEYLGSLGIPRQRILELQNTADERYFQSPASPQFEIQPRPVLLYVGQFIARKAVEHLLRAAAIIQREGRKFSLLLVGSGREKPATERLAQQLGLRNVHFYPPQAPQEMPGVYRSADVLVFPTLEDPWGLVASEAMLAGLPVLCSRHAGCAEELFSAESIFDPEDPTEFAAKLCKAVCGQLPAPDLSRLRTTPQVATELIVALQDSARGKQAQLAQSGQVTV